MSSTKTADEELSKKVRARISEIAAQLGTYPPGLAFHRPEEWAKPNCCFENVLRKVEIDGGHSAYGWTFHLKYVESMPGQAYLYLTHHAVWREPKHGMPVNVSPYPDARHHPLPGPGSDILFAYDAKAKPVVNGNVIAPLPMRFFPIGDNEELAAYVKKLNGDEQEKCRQLYESARS